MDFDDFANTFSIDFDVSDTIIIFDDARNSKVQAAEDDSLLDILDERQNVCVDFERVYINDVSIDESVSNAFTGVAQDFME